MLDKLKAQYDLDLNYLRLSFFSNSLLLNKKMYLLYNIFNRKKEFFLLKKKERQVGSYFFNYLSYNTLNNNIFNKKKEKFDYFNKWSSSYLYCSDINMKNFIINLNEKKYFLNTKISLNYTVCDDIFMDYYFNKKKSYLYLNKKMFLLNVLFKLNKKEKMQFKNFFYNNLYNHYNILNFNYTFLVINKYWCNNIYFKFFFKMTYCIKKYIIKNLYKFFIIYFKEKIEKKYKFFNITEAIEIFNLLLLPNIVNNNYIVNRKKVFFFKYIKKKTFLQKKINKIFFRYNKKYMLYLLKKKFLGLMSFNMLKNLKKRNLLNFLKKKKNHNRFSFLRNFYILRNFLPNMYLKEKYKKSRKKEKKKYNYRLIKKLKKFNYISGRSNLTRRQVYNKFKSKIIRRIKRKKKLKKKYIYLKQNKYRFNLFIYNHRNGYKNRMKAKQLKNLISPKYFYSNNKLSDYRDIEKLEKGLKWFELPDNIMTKLKKGWINKEAAFDDTIYLQGDREIRFLTYLKHYNDRKSNYAHYSFARYTKFIIKKKKQEKMKKIKNRFDSFNMKFNINKHFLWIFQKMFIFFKNINIIKEHNNITRYIKTYYTYKKIFNNFFILAINIFKLFVWRYLHIKKIKWSFYLKKIRKIFLILRLFLQGLFINKRKKRKKKINYRYQKLKRRKVVSVPLEKQKQKQKPTLITKKKEDTGFLSIYKDDKNLKSINTWQQIIDQVPWMTFKDKRIFDRKNKLYLNLFSDDNKKKKFLDWIKKTELRINIARNSYKNNTYKKNEKG